jgi:hypothetical protein
MSIKALALELYRARQKVDMIQKEIELKSGKERETLKNELKTAQKEWQMLRKMLDGRKESGSFQKRFSGA